MQWVRHDPNKAGTTELRPQAGPLTKVGVALVLFFLAVPFTSVAADGDPIDDDLETLVCGFPDIGPLLEQLPPEAGRCEPGPDYVHPAFDPPACLDCDAEAVWLSEVDRPIHDTQNVPDTPSFGIPLLTVTGGPEGSQYCITTYDTDDQEVTKDCFGGPAAGLLPPVSQTLLVVPEGETPDVEQSRTLSYWVNYTADASRVATLYSGTAGTVSTPVDLFDPDEVEWWRTNGYRTTLNVTVAVTTIDGGLSCSTCTRTVDNEVWSVPFAGQWIAAMLS